MCIFRMERPPTIPTIYGGVTMNERNSPALAVTCCRLAIATAVRGSSSGLKPEAVIVLCRDPNLKVGDMYIIDMH